MGDELVIRYAHGIAPAPERGWKMSWRTFLNAHFESQVVVDFFMDRDRKYGEEFRRILEDSGTNVLRLPPRSPNLNSYTERFVLSIKEEYLERMIFFPKGSFAGRSLHMWIIITKSGTIRDWRIS